MLKEKRGKVMGSIFILLICLGIISGAIASKKDRSFIAWFLFGFFLSILAIPMALLASPANAKKCPECAEEVKEDALKCRFCGHTFSAPAAQTGIQPGSLIDRVNQWVNKV